MKRQLIRSARPLITPLNKTILAKMYQGNQSLYTDVPNRVLVLAPHVDDETIGAGGTLKAWSKQGTDIHVAYMTDGSKSNSNLPAETIMKQRRDEAMKVKQILGINEMHFLDFKDQELVANEPFIAAIANLIKTVKPDLILVPIYIDCHPDHVATANTLKEAVKREDYQGQIWCYEINCPIEPVYINRVVDVSAVQTEKNQAIEQFTSQAIDFDGFVALSNHKTSLLYSTDNVTHVETFQAFEAGEFVAVCEALEPSANYGEIFKQVNKTETLLWGLFQARNKKQQFYKQANQREAGDKA
ncbi:PIG-L deacetylase family protein [Aquibacillus sediminis]|uniref:PIG-L deacetylase family protein n=1 Tax=Aquibacillus sediminis TaxID=2574734 RepID=UPI0014868047|nr:PIG-L deacetylase family protein [Aquibacillus sediminis]